MSTAKTINNHELRLALKQTTGVNHAVHRSNNCNNMNGGGGSYRSQLCLKDGKNTVKRKASVTVNRGCRRDVVSDVHKEGGGKKLEKQSKGREIGRTREFGC